MSTNKYKYMPSRGNEETTEAPDRSLHDIDTKYRYLPRPKTEENAQKGHQTYNFGSPPYIPEMQNSEIQEEPTLVKLFKQNPLVPIGFIGMAYCMGRGVYLVGRNTAKSDKYMDYRVMWGVFTLASIFAGSVYSDYKKKAERAQMTKQEPLIEQTLTE